MQEAMTKAKKAAQEERVVICIRHAGQTWKLAWFNEDAEGVYAGVFGRATDTDAHWAYHVNGTTYLNSAGKALPPDKASKATPIDKIVGLQQILGATTVAINSLPLVSDVFKALPKAAHVFLSDPSDFSEYTHLSVNRFLIDHSSEAASIDKLLAVPHDATMEDASKNVVIVPFKLAIIGLVTIPLRHHPKHKLAVRIMALTWPNTASDE